VEVLHCDTCDGVFCTPCVRVRECEDGCDPEEVGWSEDAVWHCSNCYLEVHPHSTESEE